MMKMNGITKPQIVTVEQTLRFLEKKGIKENINYFVCKDSASILHMFEIIKAIPGTNFFNQKGSLLVYGDSICPGLAMNFAKSLNRNSINRIDPSYKFEDMMRLVKPVYNTSDLRVSDYDYMVVFYWAIFAGNINKNVFEIADELKKKDSLKILIVYVNVDFLKSWGMKKMPQMNLK
jgi:hypothetical protein